MSFSIPSRSVTNIIVNFMGFGFLLIACVYCEQEYILQDYINISTKTYGANSQNNKKGGLT